MAVTTLAGEKTGAQKVKCNGLRGKSYKVNIYSQTTKYYSHTYTLHS